MDEKQKIIKELKFEGKMDEFVKHSLEELHIEFLKKILTARKIFKYQGIEVFNSWLVEQSNFGGGELTLSVIAYIMGITRERVRQIETSAIKKLKHPKLGCKLKQYVEDTKPLSY